MTIKFNLVKLAQNLQKVGNNLLGNAILLESSRGMRCSGFGGGYGGSIWGCSGGIMGGCTPPLNIFHPMYSDNQYNPYLTQAGMVNAEMAIHQMYEEALEQQKKNQFPGFTQTETDTTQGEEFETAMKEANKDFKFVNEAWENANNKEEKTDAEKKQINDAYNASATNAGKSYISYLDKKYGNDDGEMTLDEYTDYLIETRLGNDATSEDKADMREMAQTAFATLDLDENKKIGYKEMSSVIGFLDNLGGGKRDGKINSTSNQIFEEELFNGNEMIKEELKDSYKNLFGE